VNRSLAVAPLLSCMLPMAACVAPAPDLDARFAAGWRPSKAYCTFGGETPALGAWCAEVNFGADGLLVLARAINEDVLAQAPGRALPCTEHVASARRALAAYPEYTIEDIYSCDADPPVQAGRPVCHVSLLVTSGASGARVVLDNGYVLQPAATGGVAFYPQFAASVDRHWVGQAPDGFALAASTASRRAR
jgi:hypothetical protein